MVFMSTVTRRFFVQGSSSSSSYTTTTTTSSQRRILLQSQHSLFFEKTKKKKYSTTNHVGISSTTTTICDMQRLVFVSQQQQEKKCRVYNTTTTIPYYYKDNDEQEKKMMKKKSNSNCCSPLLQQFITIQYPNHYNNTTIRSFSTTPTTTGSSSSSSNNKKKDDNNNKKIPQQQQQIITTTPQEGDLSMDHAKTTTTTTTTNKRRKVVVDHPFKLPNNNNNNTTTTTSTTSSSTLLLESSEAERMEAYQYIRRKQKLNLERNRAKTAQNVRRALKGNMLICLCKFGAWISSGSSSMLSEFVHSVVDCGNQSLLLVGLRDASHVADRKHPYGYGKSIYFWALVSALGTFFLGAGVSMTHAVGELWNPSLSEIIPWEVWGVLGASLVIDGYVFGVTLHEVAMNRPSNRTLWNHVSRIRDPATLAILLEDGAACVGILIALAGISASHATANPIFDGLAGVGISALLASMGLILVRVNHRFLLGQAVDTEITEGIELILRNRRSIDNVHSVQSQWTSSDTFSYKAEVDFDGTFLAAKLMPRYQQEFVQLQKVSSSSSSSSKTTSSSTTTSSTTLSSNNNTIEQEELRVLLSWYAEDVIRTVEREVRHIEAEIRKVYPGAEYIELEPMSKDADRFAVDDGMESQLRKIEIEALNRYLRSLYQPSSSTSTSSSSATGSSSSHHKSDDGSSTMTKGGKGSTTTTTSKNPFDQDD